MKVLLITMFLALFGCGTDDHTDHRSAPPTDNTNDDVEKLRKQVLELQGQLDGLIVSDFKSCSGVGESADALIKRICQIAQASTNEARVELQNVVGQAISILQDQIDQGNIDMASIHAELAVINSSLSALLAIASAGMFDIEIGTELLTAGPIRETVLMKQARTSLNGYVNSVTTALSLGNNPADPTSSSPTFTITKPVTTVTVTIASPAVFTWAAHGWSNGDTVMFSTTGALPTGLAVNTLYYVKNRNINTFEVATSPSGASINTSGIQSGVHSGSLGLTAGDLVSVSDLASGSGFARGQVNGEFRVNAGATTASFDLTAKVNATAGGTFGSNIATIRRVNGRGMGTIWVTANGSDSAVRTTSASTKAYNFIVKVSGGLGYICYDTTDNAATFATIDAATTFPGLTGNINCK